MSRTWYRSPASDDMVLESNPTMHALSKNEVLKITLHIHDQSFEEEKDKKSGKFIQKKKYPRGRKIVIANNILLEDGPLEFDDLKFPHARLQNYILPREFYGISEVEQLESPQKIFNKLVSFTLDVLTFMGNPTWIVTGKP